MFNKPMLKTCQHINAYYHAFGSVITGRSFNNTNYRFGYQGSEKENINSDDASYYSTYYRILDIRLGIWLSKDPKSKANESPYVSMGNNPILNNDVLGDEFDPCSQEKVNNLKLETSNLINQLKEYKENNLKILNDKTDETNNDGILKAINEADKAIKQLETTLVEIERMEKSTTKFKISEIAVEKNGGTFVNKNGEVEMEVPQGNLPILAHELKHGYQFLSGDISYDVLTLNTGICNDVYDEVEAYQRQWAFEFFNSFYLSYDEITTSYVRNISPIYSEIKLFSEKTTLNSILTLDRFIHYWSKESYDKMTEEQKKVINENYIGKPIKIFLDDRKEFYVKPE